MDRREMLGMVGAGAVGLTAMAGTRAGAADDPHDHEHMHDKAHEDCQAACSACSLACDEAMHHCYRMVAEGKREHAKPLHLLADCSGFCGLSASMVARHSPLMAYSCMACEKACADTAAEVEKFADMPEMKAAAKALRNCERSCREMVAAMKMHATPAKGAAR